MSLERTSEMLLRLVRETRSDRISLGEIVTAMGDRAFALLLVVLALPNCVPMPPPIPLVCGFLLLFLALQLMVGRAAPWLPAQLLTRSVDRVSMSRAVIKSMPYLHKLERAARPRLNVFGAAIAMRLVGGALLILSLGLVFAAPLVGQIPLGAAIVLVGLGLIERDGVVLLAGLAVGSVGLIFSAGFVFALVQGVLAVI